MRSDRQVEASTTTRRADIYRRIRKVFDQLPARFKATELYDLAGILNHTNPGHRMMIASVLEYDFKCIQIRTPSGKSSWKKP